MLERLHISYPSSLKVKITDLASNLSIREFGEDHEFTKLVVDLKGKDPDDAFSTVPYEKGFTFLYYLEKQIGKDKFDKFIPHVCTYPLSSPYRNTKYAVVLHNLRQKIHRLLRIQIHPPSLLLQRQRSLRLPQEPRLGQMVLRPWLPTKARLRYLPSGRLLCLGLQMGKSQ